MAHRGDVRLYTQPWTRLLAQRRAEQRFHRGDRACGVRITRLLPGLSARGVRGAGVRRDPRPRDPADRKSTRLNSSHTVISYAVFCLKKKKTKTEQRSSNDTYKN